MRQVRPRCAAPRQTHAPVCGGGGGGLRRVRGAAGPGDASLPHEDANQKKTLLQARALHAKVSARAVWTCGSPPPSLTLPFTSPTLQPGPPLPSPLSVPLSSFLLSVPPLPLPPTVPVLVSRVILALPRGQCQARRLPCEPGH